MTWLPSCSGRPIELVHPTVDEVDFRELAHALAHLNRFAGNAATPVSVALHTLIGCDLAPETIRPWWLLHDGHEGRTGEVTSPAKDALRAVADERYGERSADIVELVWRELEARHDIVIHAAAGLARPTREQLAEIKRIDLVALATERRDFCAPQTRPWIIDGLHIRPHSKVYRWKPPADVADELHARFRRYLPALNGRRAVA